MKVVVIGASVVGLLAARALTDVAQSIAVVDRDNPPDAAVARKSVPPGRHVHGVLAGGLDVLQSFFPGILDDLVADGSHVVDSAKDVLWFALYRTGHGGCHEGLLADRRLQNQAITLNLRTNRMLGGSQANRK